MAWQLDRRVSVTSIITLFMVLVACFGTYYSLVYKTDMTTVVLESLVERVEKVEGTVTEHELKWAAHEAVDNLNAD